MSRRSSRISEISFKFDKETKGIEIKKNVTEKVEAGYGVEQTQKLDGNIETKQKVSGEYKVTDSISVGAERGITQEKNNGTTQDTQKANDKVTIKFKKEF